MADGDPGVDLLRPLNAHQREVAADLDVEMGALIRRLHHGDLPDARQDLEPVAGRAGRTLGEALAAAPDWTTALRVWTLAVPELAAQARPPGR
ncbi:hypothetical protein AB0469_26475 [Streptomyces sp. NPDC093801]|uniref:hypothetical protein n=1 Tax=Streptomyces sp. NPDC093801 TaxID=3155203 RepID=UPI00344D808C